jgi:hypothetical protein
MEIWESTYVCILQSKPVMAGDCEDSQWRDPNLQKPAQPRRRE